MTEEVKCDEDKSIRHFITKPLVVTITTILMGSLQYGYNMGVVANTQDFVTDFMNRTIKDRNGSYPSENTLTNIWAISVAVLFLGGCAGVLSNKWILQYISRRRGEFLNILLGFIATAVLMSARPSEKWELFLVGRLLSGFHCGIYTGLTAVYLTESSPKEIRGSLNTLNVLGIVTGVLVGQIMGFPIIFGTDDRWEYAYAFAMAPRLIQLVLLPFCVESPSYLMIVLKDEDRARKALQTLRHSHDVEDEIEVLRKEMTNDIETVSLFQLFRHPPHRRATMLAVISQFSLHMAGIVGVLSYANALFQDSAGLSETSAAYAVSSIGLVSIIMTLIIIPLAELVGRRRLHLLGHTGIIFSYIMITMCFALKDDVHGLDKASIAFVLLFVIFFNIGPAPVPHMLLGDMFTQETRPAASSAALTCNWMASFIMAYTFPPMKAALNAYVFLPIIVYEVMATTYFYFCQPETKGKTFQEVSMLFEKPGDTAGGRLCINRKSHREKEPQSSSKDSTSL